MSKTLNTTIDIESEKKLQVLVAGTYTVSEGYPNVKYRIETLKRDKTLHIKEVRFGSSTKIDYARKRGRLFSLIALALGQLIHSFSCVVTIIKNRQFKVLYLPYPAVPVLVLLSVLPRRLLPQRIVMDAFISLYDTIVLDRRLIAKRGLPATVIHFLERRALTTATAVITDTPENSGHIRSLYDLPSDMFYDVPLAINERVFKPVLSSFAVSTSTCRMLFVGTLVPLHRVDILLKAISQLTPSRAVELTFIGDGQQSSLLQLFIEERDFDDSYITVKWIREWLSSEQIARYINNSDVCLGIMGSDGKSSRVWPFKNYLYMACGKTLITARTPVTDRLTAKLDYDPFIAVATTDVSELSKQLALCIDNPDHCRNVAANAARFFRQYLSQDTQSLEFRKIIANQL